MRATYRAGDARVQAAQARCRPKRLKVERAPRLRARVLALLRMSWSPASNAGRSERTSRYLAGADAGLPPRLDRSHPSSNGP